MKNKHLTVVTITALHTIICILSGALGWDLQFLIVLNTGIASLLIIYKKYGLHPLQAAIILLPFYISYTFFSIYLKSYQTYPIWMLGLLTVSLTFYMIKSRKFLAVSTGLLFIQIAGAVFVLPNNFAFLSIKENPSTFQLQDTEILNQVNQRIGINTLHGKVVLLDVWHSACGTCIKNFPKLQSLQNDFETDTLVTIYAANIPLSESDRTVSDSITAGYSFKKIYFKDRNEARKLPITGLPLLLILDKNGVCRYAGGLNTNWNIFFGNAKTLINKLKQES